TMYSLDINFLNDREGQATATAAKPAQVSVPMGEQVPLMAGLAVAIALPALTAGAWFYFQNRVTSLEAQQQELQTQITSLQAKKKEADTFNAEAEQIKAEIQGLVGVFNQIKPSSAILQDISDRVPIGVQLNSLNETGGKVNLSGTARSYNDVNDFLLVLQKSPFLKPTETQLKSAQLTAYSTPIELAGANKPETSQATPGGEEPKSDVTITAPQVVSYTIETSLSDTPAAELLPALESKGAGGLVTRIRALKEKGVI
ncbi:MAG: PilN domain-containing protein, partial [Leptolyngbyaceae bacterium]|nr:PilN domain-containing protein [Leptolyngbyaceae bacterium]